MRDKKCEDWKNVRIVVGDDINLVSTVEKSQRNVGEDINLAAAGLQSCHFVFTGPGDSHKCCFGSACADKSCQEDEVVITVGNNTCNLTIKSVAHSNAGTYQSFDKDAKLIEGCKLTVENTLEISKWAIIGPILYDVKL